MMTEEVKEEKKRGRPPKEAPAIVQDEKSAKEKWLDEVIHVEFMNIEEPGVPNVFVFGTTKKPEKHTLLHGGKYHLSRRVIQHIESRQTPIYSYRPDGTGMMSKSLTGYKPRFQCRQVFE